MLPLKKGRYIARLAETGSDLRAAQALRYGMFRADCRRGGQTRDRDEDRFDERCIHVLVEEQQTGRLVCCYRLLVLKGGSEINQSYSAQYYELSALSTFEGPMVEVGRFCVDPQCSDPDVLRVAWGALTRIVDSAGAEMLFGCSSFRGTQACAYKDAFALLKERHIAPKRWLPKVKAPTVFRFAQRLRRKPDARRAMLGMPPLLRSYLAMGGWVSDHAVVDTELNTLHVFTGLEIGAIPSARARLLRAEAG